MASFQFHSLESASHFRILYLDASADDEQLSGSLLHHNLDEHPTYDCLSYVWGCPTLSHSVLVDGAPFPVTANLYSALKRIRARSANGRIAIWADGICINQGDIPERNQQVNLMGRIYSECQTGLMYLGEAADGSDLLPDFLRSLLASMRTSFYEMDRPITHNFINRYEFPEETHPGWKILKSFLRRSWFRRVWIVQEFALPPQIRMICGHWEIPGKLLAVLLSSSKWRYSQIALNSFVDEENRTAFTSHRVHLDVRLAVGRDKQLHPDSYPEIPSVDRVKRRNQSLIWLLYHSESFLATDPRDRIFALIPLSSDSKNLNLTIDYSKTMETVAREITQYFLHNGYGLSLLLSTGEAKSSTDSPSWYPNWTNSGVPLKRRVWPMRYERIPDCQIIPDPDTQAITVTGSIVDMVQDEGVLVGNKLLVNEENKWIEEIDALVARIQTYPTGQSLDEATWRTLVGNRSLGMDSTAPDSYGHFYQECRTVNTKFDRGNQSLKETKEVVARMFNYEVAILRGYRFSITPKKLFSMVPREAEVGDSVFFVKGDPEKATFLIRKDPVLDQYRLVGHAYVHGIWSVLKLNDLEDKVITMY